MQNALDGRHRRALTKLLWVMTSDPGVQGMRSHRSISTTIKLAMKLTTIFLLAACIGAAAAGKAQGIDLHEKNATLVSVFQKLEQQTGYNFYYKVELLQNAKKVTLNVKNASLE